MNTRMFVLIAAVLALIGIIVQAGFDLDNVYDMTTTTLFGLIFIVTLIAAFMCRKK